MKRLLIAIAAAATTMFASAAVLKQAAFEGTLDGGFTGGGGTATLYDNDGPDDADADYPFSGFGNYYCAIDADSDSPLTNSVSGTVFDMYVQFKAVEGAEVPSDAKIAIYLNSDGKLVVVGDQAYDCGSPVAADSWARLTIAQVSGGYKVYVGGIALAATGITDNTFPAKNSGAATTVAFTGSGKLDNFVARTTDPFDQPSTYVASVGGETGERYATFADALADAAADSVIELNGNVDGTFALPAAGAKIKLNGYTFSGFASVTGDPLLVAVASSADADGVTTYSSAYFPRTATAGQDGSAEHPYEIADVDDLKALQAYTEGYGLCYVQTADIDMSEAGAFAGIGVYNATPTSGTPFTGTYDGGGFKICNVDFTQRNYGGVFNQVNGGTIKNLTVSNITCSAFSSSVNSGEWGGAIVGNAGNGATLQNLVAEGTFAADHPATHNVAGIVVRACGGGENGTLIKNCTNNATVYGAYTKMAGICAIAQHKVDGGPVTFDGCSNTGTLTMPSGSTAGRDGLAGIIGYVNDDTVLKGCSNTGSMTSTLATAKIGQLVGWAYNSVLTFEDAGTIAANGPAKIGDFGSTVVLDWAISGDPGKNFDFNVYGATGSTVELLQDFTGYPPRNAVINPTLKLSANMTINDGWQNETNATFTAISGTGTLTASHKYNYVKFYRIKKLDGFTGTLASGQPQVYFVIDDIVAAETPAYGTAVVKGGSSLKVYDLASTTLGGAAADLCVDTLDNQNGIYLAAAQVVADDNSTTGYASVENALAAADAANASSVNVLDANAEEVAATGWSYANGVYTSTREVATLNDTSYTSLVRALAAAQEGDTVTLVAASPEAVTIPAGVTVAVTDDVVFSGTLSGAGAIKYTKVPQTFPASTLVAGEWTGTFIIAYNQETSANIAFNSYGISGSYVEIAEGYSLTGHCEGGTLATLVVNGTLNIVDGSSTATATIYALAGSGNVSVTQNRKYTFSNLVDWNGKLTSNGNLISIGNITSGAGSIEYQTTPAAAPTVGEDFEGEVYLNFNYSNYDVYKYAGANATVKLGTMTGHLHDGAGTSGQTGEIPGKTVVSGAVVINNGWTISSANWTAAKVVKFDSLKVDGSLTLDSTATGFGSARCYYYAKSLDAAGVGTITVGDGFGLRIDAVDFAEAPSGSDVLVGLTLAKADLLTTDGQLFGTDGKLDGSIAVTVNGEATEQTLVYDADKGGLVLYVAPTYAARDSLGNNYTDVPGALSYVYTMGTAGDYVTVLDEDYEDDGSYADYFTWDATARTYTLRAMVAMCDNVKYATLAAAVGGAAEGKTIILLADIALTETQTISKSVTLNLSGHNVTATDCRAFHVTAGTVAFTGTGTISTVVTQGTKLASSSSVIRVGSNTAETNFTLGENVTVTSDYCYGITYFGTQAQTVAINGTVAVTGAQAAISGNGTSTMAAVTLTVGGTVSATQDYAIYNPQTGTTAITGTVTGGIEVKAGTVTVAGTATVTARNVTPSHSSNQDGTSTQGYAIASVGNSSYKQPAKVSVAAGATVTGSVIILKENNSETYGEITSAVNTLTIPEGYVWNGPVDGVYTLAVYVAPAVIDPTAGTPIVAADEAAAQAAAQALNVGGMPEVSGLDQTAWNGYFTRYAEETTAGGWVAKAVLNPEAVFDATPTAEATDEQAILTAVLDSKAAGATLQTAKPGLYYSLEGATTLGFVEPVEGARTLAEGNEVTVAKPAITGTAVFFRVKVSVTAE